VHPRYLDRQALIACWREALLAQAVIDRPAGGYGHHPQLERFRDTPQPAGTVAAYLSGLADEADARGYRFVRAKILPFEPSPGAIPVTVGQLRYEWGHLTAKLERRSPDVAARWGDVIAPEPHPLFRAVDGPVEPWERPKS
jgi:hypothetical protein